MFIPPPLLLIIAISLSYMVSIAFPGLQYDGLSFSWIGLIAISVGIFAVTWGRHLLVRHKTTLHPHGKPTKLVTRGPYAHSRNPIYLGFLLIAIGTALLFANVLAFAGPVIFFAFASIFIIPFEEDMLHRKFGDAYRRYRKSTRRWL